MTVSKQRISSPLEAGRSILETHNLPPQLTGALEYVSKRLARKGLHITLVAVKSEHQLHNAPPPTCGISPPQTPDPLIISSGFSSPSRLAFAAPLTGGLRHLVRRGTGGSSSSSSSSSSLDSASASAPGGWASPTFSSLPREAALPSPRRWILPLAPGSPLPSTPMTPHTPSSFTTTMTAATSSCATSYRSQTLDSFGVRLVYAAPICLKDEKTVRAAITKAERKFQTGIGALSISTPLACGLSPGLIRRSIEQNEILFSSDGLTLLGLDRLYSFKAALAAYARSFAKPTSRTHTPLSSPGLSNHPVHLTSPKPPSMAPDSTRLEDAVDSLRRLILSNGDRPIAKADLYRSFEWMGVNQIALADVEHMYKRAYGGPERRSPFEVPLPLASMAVKEEESGGQAERETKRAGFIKVGAPPPPKSPPALKLNTSIATSPKLVKPKPKPVPRAPVQGIDIIGMTGGTEADGSKAVNNETIADTGQDLVIDMSDLDITVEHGEGSGCVNEDNVDRTAYPPRDGPIRPSMLWPNGKALGVSIDELLSPCDNRQSQRLGPMTPNGYDDISPITRGEWGFLFKGATWTQGRTAVVETC